MKTIIKVLLITLIEVVLNQCKKDTNPYVLIPASYLQWCISGKPGYFLTKIHPWLLPGVKLFNQSYSLTIFISISISSTLSTPSTFIFFLLSFILIYPIFDTVFRFVLKTYHYVNKNFCQCRYRYRCRDCNN